MKGLDMRDWSFLDLLGVALFSFGAAFPALNALLKDAPAVAAWWPVFLTSPYLPPLLLFAGLGLLAYRTYRRARAERLVEHAEEDKHPRARRAIGSFQIPADPPSDFMLLPKQYSVEFGAT